MKYTFALILLFWSLFIFAQNENTTMRVESAPLPYAEIPEAPAEYNACTVAARMIDGLGFRYYWATEGLRPVDLAYQPREDARTVEATIEHIYGLTNVVYSTIHQHTHRPQSKNDMTFANMRVQTLMMLKSTSDALRAADPNALESFNLVFERNGKQSDYPFWNLLNGPLADAMWHVGQVVSFRRASGNPINARVRLLSGTVKTE